jgi:hypothetical protein
LKPQKYIPRINFLHFSLLLLNSSPLLYICSFPCTHVAYRNVGDTKQTGLEWDAAIDREGSLRYWHSHHVQGFFLWHPAKEISVAYFLTHECYKSADCARTPTITVTVILLTGHQAQVGVLSPAHVRLLDSTTEGTILKGKYRLAFARRILPWINLTS